MGKSELTDFYRNADKYADRLDSHGDSSYAEYIAFVKRFVARGSRILDIGCGTGLSSLLLSGQGYDVAGMDVSPLFIERAKAKENSHLEFICADIFDMPFAKEAFDCAAMFLVIEHLTDIPRVIEEMLRVTKKGGRIIILSPNLLSPFNSLFPIVNVLLGRKREFLLGVDKLSDAFGLLIKNTNLLISKKLSTRASFVYREPVLENRFDYAADSDATYLSCPVDIRLYLDRRGGVRILNYQGYGRLGRFLPDFSTGIHIAAEKK